MRAHGSEERRDVGVDVEQGAVDAAVEEQAGAAAHAGFAVAEDIPGKAEPGHEVAVGRGDAVRIEPRIASELHSGRRKRILVEWVFDAQSVGLKPPMRPFARAMARTAPSARRSPASDCGRFPAVLHVGALKLAAGIEELAVCLVHLKRYPNTKLAAASPVPVALKLNWPGSSIEVIDVDLRHLAVVAGVDVVLAQQEMDIVGQRVVSSAEGCLPGVETVK